MGKKLEVNLAWCKGCGICAAFCPKQILKIKGGKVQIVDAEACLKCGLCESLCPDFAIYLAKEEEMNHG